MNKFNQQQIDLLKPLLEQEVVLHFPFCANTFAIAYHYSVLVNQAKAPQDLIRFHDWKNPFPSASGLGSAKAEPARNETARAASESAAENEPTEEGDRSEINVFYAVDINAEQAGLQKPTPLSTARAEATLPQTKTSLSEVNVSGYCPRFVF